MKSGILIPNNSPVATRGLLTSTAVATGDLCHLLSPLRNARIRKIMWSNNTGFNGTIIFGSQDNVAIPAFVPLFPTITCINGFDGVLTEHEIPDVLFAVDTAAGAAGLSGDVYVLTSIAGIIIRLSVEER